MHIWYYVFFNIKKILVFCSIKQLYYSNRKIIVKWKIITQLSIKNLKGKNRFDQQQ